MCLGDGSTLVDTKNEYGLMDYIGFDERGSRLLYFKAAADIENKMKISKKLLKTYVCTLHGRPPCVDG